MRRVWPRISIDAELFVRLLELSRRRGVGLEELLDEAIRRYLSSA